MALDLVPAVSVEMSMALYGSTTSCVADSASESTPRTLGLSSIGKW